MSHSYYSIILIYLYCNYYTVTVLCMYIHASDSNTTSTTTVFTANYYMLQLLYYMQRSMVVPGWYKDCY